MRRVVKYSRWQVVLVALVCIAVGCAAGWISGRAALEREWSAGEQPLSDKAVAAMQSGDADPVPGVGTMVLPPAPYTRARTLLASSTSSDPVRVRIGAVGNGDDGAELHLDVENHAPCTITQIGGVAHGYDATGKSAKMNLHGEHFVAFSIGEQSVAPNEHGQFAQKLRYPDTASLVLARVDSYACADGQTWSRPR